MDDPTVEAGPFVVTFPADLYDPAALKRAAYALMARATVSIEMQGSEIHCSITPEVRDCNCAILERDFRREVLDQDLRLVIESKTEMMRDTILGLTFSRSGLQG